MVIGHGPALSTPEYFDVAECLARRITEQEAAHTLDEPEDPPDDSEDPDPLPFWINPTPSTSFYPLSPAPPPPRRMYDGPPTEMDYKKEGSKRRRARKRAEEQERNGIPGVKAIHLKRQKQALGATIQVNIDVNDLPRTKPAWIGKRNPQDDHTFEDGMGGRIYTEGEIRELTGEDGMRYINWLGVLSIPIIDAHGRIIAVLGGTPRDVEGWRAITDRAATLMETKATRLRHTEDQLHHRRAQEPYPSVDRGPSYGGGQTEPLLFRIFAPMLFLYYQMQMELLRSWNPSMVWNVVFTVFAACTFNFGPHALTVPHLDFGNLAWGWCVITAPGRFNPDRGGHLILWDLKLVIRFPPGSTILIPSAIIRHSNSPIAADEFRCSFVQEEKRERMEESKTRWEKGVAMYSTIDSLRT
ncbi:hypothetical protein B0H16DRAFT_1732606 [Mycena metata]|uniref:Uncharacterized protein n=1 Tax=Mycena metata TaxID=1033252 RepID=A0AAD7I290_9AGAR|nr:hypothetical protein B0H16DRAFT_1732606 [Mycena metata]